VNGEAVSTEVTVSVPSSHDRCVILAATATAEWITVSFPTADQGDDGDVATEDVMFSVAKNRGAARSGAVTLGANLVIRVYQPKGN
jgi:hypothetical protein